MKFSDCVYLFSLVDPKVESMLVQQVINLTSVALTSIFVQIVDVILVSAAQIQPNL